MIGLMLNTQNVSSEPLVESSHRIV